MEPNLTLEDYQTAKRVLQKIFNEYGNIDLSRLTKEQFDQIRYEEAAVCEAMRQIDIDMIIFEEGEEEC